MKYYVVIETRDEVDAVSRLEMAAKIADQWEADVTVCHSMDDLAAGEED